MPSFAPPPPPTTRALPAQQTWGGFAASNAQGRPPLQAGRGLLSGGRGRGRGRGRAGYLQATAALVAPGKASLTSRFMHEQLREDLKHRAACIQAQLPAGQDPRIPPTLQQFHSLYPLEDVSVAEEMPSQVFGVCSLVLKGNHRASGAAYALRRLEGAHVGLSPQLVARAQRAVDGFGGRAQHPHLVVPRDVFVSTDMMGGPGLVFVYEYFPAAVRGGCCLVLQLCRLKRVTCCLGDPGAGAHATTSHRHGPGALGRH